LTVEVVFPTPPFWLRKAATRGGMTLGTTGMAASIGKTP